MTKIYFINNKKIDLDSSEWNRIYYDGSWSDRGINLFWRKKDDCFILEKWSNWQNEKNSIGVCSREEAIEFLLVEAENNHPQRASDALEIIGYEPEKF